MAQQNVAIVTGGMAGMGLSIAKKLTDDGFLVGVGARRADDPDLNAKTRNAIGNAGYIGFLDVSDSQSVNSFVEQVTNRLGAPSVLVNNAGVTVHQHTDGHDDDTWENVININLNGPFRMIRACLPAMKQQKWGRIINIGSTAARAAEPTHAAYCASKAGLIGMTKSVAREGGPYGINCVAISPTWVETDMLRASAATMARTSGRTVDAIKAEMAEMNYQNRLVQPEEIANLVSFCASDACAGLTMEDIQVNAGAFW